MFVKSAFLTIVIVFAAILMQAQPDVVARNAVRSRFDTPNTVQWVHTFRGVWQNFHPIEIVLGFDGTTYHGTLHLITGDVRFDLYGYHQDGKAMIQEIDQTGRTSGYLIVSIHDGLMTGQWWSADFSRSALISLRDENVIELRKFEPELLILEGKTAKQMLSLIIQREESNLLSGFCSGGNSNLLYRLSGHCEDGLCEQMHLDMQAPEGHKYILQAQRRRNMTFQIEITDTAGTTEAGTASVTQSYPMQRIHYIGYTGSLDCIYPTLHQSAFDTWLGSQIELWGNTVRKHLDALQHSTVTPGPDVRWSVQASAWIDFTLVTTEVVSGLITMYNPVAGKYERNGFIFDSKAGKPLSMKEIGRRPQFEDMLRDDAEKIAPDISDDPGYDDWYKNQDFRHVAITESGFVMTTDFDPVYGDSWVMLKFKDYVESMKKNAFVFDQN